MDQAEMNRLFQNAIEHAQAELQQKHEERIKALEADREAQIKVVEDRSSGNRGYWQLIAISQSETVGPGPGEVLARRRGRLEDDVDVQRRVLRVEGVPRHARVDGGR